MQIRAQSRHRTKQEENRRQEKKAKRKKIQTGNASEAGKERTEESPELNPEMDLEDERWAQRLKVETPEFEDNKSRDHTEGYEG